METITEYDLIGLLRLAGQKGYNIGLQLQHDKPVFVARHRKSGAQFVGDRFDVYDELYKL